MCKERENKTEQQVVEEFDQFIKQEILNASNEYRKEKGLPTLTESEVNEMEVSE